MANPRDPLMRHQSNLLRLVAGRGLCTDLSLAAYCNEVGVELDRTALVHYRAGRRQAPLGLLALLLQHCDPAEVLGAIAHEHGLRVVHEVEAAPAPAGLMEATLRATIELGDVARVTAEALADGTITNDERELLLREIDEAAQVLAEMRESLASPLRSVK